jgi:hypothetical protein
MQQELNAGPGSGDHSRSTTVRVATLLAWSLLALSACKKEKAPASPAASAATPAATASATPEPTPTPAKPEDQPTRELREIGEKVVAAIKAKDTDALMLFDQNTDDQASLAGKNGELYCYLFDTTCNPKGRSVFDIFTEAHQLRVDPLVTDVPLLGKRYGQLIFYDKRVVNEQQLYTPDFLCSERGLKQTVTWHFIYSDGKWNSTTVFDYKVDRCRQ